MPVRYAWGAAIVLSYVAREMLEFARMPRGERERWIDMVLDAVTVGDDECGREKDGARP
jgi:hypothetical protein